MKQYLPFLIRAAHRSGALALCLLLVSTASAQVTKTYQRANRVADYNEGCLVFVCGDVADHQKAVDTDTVSAAQVTSPLALATASLRLHFPTVVEPGEQAKVALSSQAGLNLSTLSKVQIRTYLGSEKDARQDISAGNLLTLATIRNNVTLLSFPVTAQFDELEVRVQGAVTASYSVRVHYAQTSLPTPLPVTLTSFTGHSSSQGIDLRWQTATEQDASHFVVERSATGHAPFVRIGELQSQGGNSSQLRSYAFRDASAPGEAAATLYYRLRQVDHSGAVALSPVVAVTKSQAPGTAQLQVYPSPAPLGTALRLSWSAPGHGSPKVVLYDSRGALCWQARAGEPGQPFGPALPTAGLYLAVLVDEQGQPLARHRFMVEQAR